MENYRLYVDGSAIGNVNVTANTPEVGSCLCQNGCGDNRLEERFVQLSGLVITDPIRQFIGAKSVLIIRRSYCFV